jgi:hypothetical protein
MTGCVCHFVTPSVDASRGGLPELGRRLARGLAASGAARVVVHALNQTPEDATGDGFDLRPLMPARAAVAAPLAGADASILRLGSLPAQGYQINEAVLQASLDAERARHPLARHIIVSFSLVRLGYTCQRLADAVGWPHIAVVTGSDFTCDLADPALSAAAAQVMERADWIVALNEAHRAALSRRFARHERLSVCHGALPAGAPASTWQPHDRNERMIVSDTGYSFKKATHLLIGACDRLRGTGHDVQLSVVGRTAAEEAAFWAQFQSDAGRRSRPWATLSGYLAKSQMEQFLLAGDIYCSASLGEGSSNAALFALALGMPMVCTRTGSLPELADIAGDWLALVPPGDEPALADALGTMLKKLAKKTIAGPHGGVETIRRRLGPQREVEAWITILDRVGDRR